MATHNGNALRESANPGNVAERSLHRGRSLNIGKLPPLIQDELNHRLLTNESSTSLLRWLNYVPQVVAVLRDHFEGSPISPQNISEWRQGGYLQWLIQSRNVVRQRTKGGPLETEPYHGPFDDDAVNQAESQLRREQATERDARQAQSDRQARAAALARRAGRPTSSDEFHDQIDSLYEDAADLGDDVIGAKDLLHVITARYAELLQDWGKVPETDFDRRMETLQKLTKNIAVVRRLEQNDERLDFLREKERNKSKSASSRPARASRSPSASKTTESPSETPESASESSANSQPPSPAAEGAPQCGAGFQPASATGVTNSAPIHQSTPSSTPPVPSAPSDESDTSDTSDPSDKSPAPNAPPAPEANATPGGSALAAHEQTQPVPIPPTNYSQFPPNSRDRRSRFGLL